ncbi:MAG: prephenate dehydrogenase/arogenate dehydrogenase family protein [Gammaproteobacteria bacterium]|nr:prephenate dehydrogenase/arogenate dehydrogenase family protein [Gammaproteobacteria bacterium]
MPPTTTASWASPATCRTCSPSPSVDFIARRDDAASCFELAAGGFFDFTRIASSDPVMWRDISLDNADALSTSLGEFITALEQVRAMVDEGRGDELASLFRNARDARDRVVDQRRRTGS